MAADEFTHIARDAVGARGRFTVALAGGSTPRGIYSLLAEDARKGVTTLPWDRMHFFWGDERCVLPDHPDSNYRMASETLLSKVPVPPANVHRVRTELSAARAAAEYEAMLREFFLPEPGLFPRFDLIILGIGPDGHTASLFPKTAALSETLHLVAANWVDKLQAHRITLTLPVLNAASAVMFVVSGGSKAEVVRQVLAGQDAGCVYPAGRVQPASGRLLWLLDSAAASLLPPDMDPTVRTQ